MQQNAAERLFVWTVFTLLYNKQVHIWYVHVYKHNAFTKGDDQKPLYGQLLLIRENLNGKTANDTPN